jgi:hypothetical protein
MRKSISVNEKKRGRGRPVTTGTGTVVGVRLLPDLLAAVDEWAQHNANGSRTEAIRLMIKIVLKRDGKR